MSETALPPSAGHMLSVAVAATWVAANPAFKLELASIELGPVVAHG
ncbi:MAG: hypothetical protein R6W06_04560 [Prochlorococcaceae cyanobacterium]